MADFNIKGQVEVDDKGSLKKVGKNAKDTADSFDRLGRSQNSYNKREKGVAGATANSTKAFSKMTTGIRGGLVPAYAVLAANIFALTAAFNALRRAAQVEDLARGLQFIGNVAGRDLKRAAERIRDVTGAAVSMGDAMRTTAVGISAGFRTDQLEQLARVAKGASIALGRDMGDALDRLTRGVAKLEPEILDELGILVRLDEAADKYAAKLGTTADALTRFQRQQAFLNDTIEQGIKKYGDIADQLDPNAYDQLAAAAANLSNSFLNLLNNTLKLGAVAEGLSKSNTALLASTSLLGAGIARQLAPGMFEAAQRSADAARTFRDQSIETAKGIKISGQYGTVMAGLATKIQKGEDSSAEFTKAQKLVGSQIKRNETIEKRYQKQLELGVGNQQKIQANLEKTQQRLAALRQGQEDLTQVEEGRLVSTRQQLKANSLAQAQSGNLVGAFKSLNQSIALTNASTATSTARTGKLIKGLRRLRNGALRTAGAVKILGTAFLSFLPLIGLVVTAVSLLWETFKKQPSEAGKALQEATNSLENLKNINDQFLKASYTESERVVRGYIAMSGAIEDVISNLTRIASLESDQARNTRLNAEVELDTLNQRRARLQEISNLYRSRNKDDKKLAKELLEQEGFRGGFWDKFLRAGSTTNEIADIMSEINNEIKAADRELTAAKLGEEQQRLKNTKVYIKGVLEEFTNLRDQEGSFAANLSEKEFKKFENLLQSIYDTEGITIDGDFIKLTELDAQQLGKALEASFGEAAKFILQVGSSFRGLEDAVGQTSTQLSKATQRQKREYDDLISSLTALSEEYSSLGLSAKATGADVENLSAVQKEFLEQVEKLNLPDRFKTPQGLLDLRKILTDATYGAADLVKEAENLEASLKQLSSASKQVGVQNIESIEMAIDRQAKLQRLEALRLQEAAARVLLESKSSKEREQGSSILDRILKERASIEGQIASIVDIQTQEIIESYKVQQDILKIEGQRIQLITKVAKVEQSIQNFKAGRGYSQTLVQEYKTRIKTAIMALEIASREIEIQEALLDLKRAQLELKFLEDGVLNDNEKRILAIMDRQIENQRELNKLKLAGLEADIKAAKFAGGANVFDKLGLSNPLAYLDQLSLAAEKVSQTSIKEVPLPKDSGLGASLGLNAQSSPLQSDMPDSGLGASLGLDAQSSPLTRITETVQPLKASILDLTATAMMPFIESLSSLGPEGEIASNFAAMSLTIQSGMLAISETAEGSKERLAATFAIMGSIVGQIGNIMNAASQARIDAIDKEIEAEKKRDGKSAKSLAKIKQLEAKRESEKRKQFERDKKAKMAQVVMNTAAGIAMTIGETGFLGIPLAAIVAALGAAQLAIIAGTSYQGGASSSGGGVGLSSVSVGGDRENRVDVARATSPAGEMAYMRGQQGVGNMTNFRPGGFTGRRYMAFGGYTGFMVGEQGPEMFFPDRPGTVMPADDTAEMTGSPTNVNFTINTIDSQGVEDFIFANRGGMIDAIREAANSHGQAFLEGVDVLQDRDRASGNRAFADVPRDRR